MIMVVPDAAGESPAVNRSLPCCYDMLIKGPSQCACADNEIGVHAVTARCIAARSASDGLATAGMA